MNYIFSKTTGRGYAALLEYRYTGMCTRPSEPRSRSDSRPMSPRRDRDIQNFVRDRDETLQFPRCWPRPWSSWDSRGYRELQHFAETFSM